MSTASTPGTFPPLFTKDHLRLRQCRYGLMLYNLNDVYLGVMLDRHGEYSQAEADMFRHFLGPGMTVVEVGANVGAHTLALAQFVGPRGRVLAFEPQRGVFQMLCANLALNGIEHVEAHWAAVGSAPGRIRVPRLPSSMRNNFGGISIGGEHGGDEVPLLTLDSLALSACDLMKIDVEGMEIEVIEGARDTIRRLRPTISVENDREDKSPDLIRLLWDLDYDCYWDTPFYTHVPNFRGDPEDVFPKVHSVNLLCLPREQKKVIGRLRRVEDPLESWPARMAMIASTNIVELNNRGFQLHELKRYDQALAFFDRVLALDPKLATAFLNRAYTLVAQRRYDEALADYDRALALEPDNIDGLNNRGFVLIQLDRREEALACLDRALALAPDHADARRNRDYLTGGPAARGQ